MIKTKIVGTNTNGDIEYKVKNDANNYIRTLGCILGFLLACLLCFFIQKWISFPFLSTISCFIALFAIVLLGFMYCRSRLIAKEETFLVTDAIRFIAEQDAIKRNQKVVKIKFFSDALDPYGRINDEYIMVLLSDKTVLKYQIEQLDCKNKIYNYKLIKKDFSVCTNKTEIQKILRPNFLSILMNSQAFITLIIWVIILGILAIGAFVIFLFFMYTHDAYDVIVLFLIYLSLLIFIPLNRYVDSILPKNRVCNVIRFILSIPIFVLKISNLLMPFLTILMTITFMFALSFLPIFLIVTIIEFLGYSIALYTKLFIFIAFTSIIASQGSTFIRNIILRQSPFAMTDHHFQLLMRELVKFIYTKENLNFIIYAGYFFFLTFSILKTLQTGETLLNQEIDLIVTKSFLVYIACTNMFERKKSSNIEGGTLLTIFIKILLAKDDENWIQKRKTHSLDDD